MQNKESYYDRFQNLFDNILRAENEQEAIREAAKAMAQEFTSEELVTALATISQIAEEKINLSVKNYEKDRTSEYIAQWVANSDSNAKPEVKEERTPTPNLGEQEENLSYELTSELAAEAEIRRSGEIARSALIKKVSEMQSSLLSAIDENTKERINQVRRFQQLSTQLKVELWQCKSKNNLNISNAKSSTSRKEKAEYITEFCNQLRQKVGILAAAIDESTTDAQQVIGNALLELVNEVNSSSNIIPAINMNKFIQRLEDITKHQSSNFLDKVYEAINNLAEFIVNLTDFTLNKAYTPTTAQIKYLLEKPKPTHVEKASSPVNFTLCK